MDGRTKDGGASVLAAFAIAVDVGLGGIALCGLIPCGTGYALQAALVVSLVTLGAPLVFAIAIAGIAGWLAPAGAMRVVAWSPLGAAVVFGILAAMPHTGVDAGFCRIDL